jgi:hypothetical protein
VINTLKKLSIISLAAASLGTVALTSADAQSMRGSEYYGYAQPQTGYTAAYPGMNYGYTTQSRLGSGTEFHTYGQPGSENGYGFPLFGF